MKRSLTPLSPPGRNLSPPERRLLLLRFQVARLSRGEPLPWRVLGDSIHAHVRAGTRVEELAAVLDLSVAQVRRIRQQHSVYDPAADRGTPRQLGMWGTPAAGAAAAGTSTTQLDRWRRNAEAAGVTVLQGEQRLWHHTATAAWWADLATVDALRGRRTARDDRAEHSRRLRAAGMPVAAIAAQLGASVMTIRRDLWATTTTGAHDQQAATERGWRSMPRLSEPGGRLWCMCGTWRESGPGSPTPLSAHHPRPADREGPATAVRTGAPRDRD